MIAEKRCTGHAAAIVAGKAAQIAVKSRPTRRPSAIFPLDSLPYFSTTKSKTSFQHAPDDNIRNRLDDLPNNEVRFQRKHAGHEGRGK